MKETFDREKYKSRRYVMHCQTQEEFVNFLKYLDRLGETWGENNSLLDLFDVWHNYADRTVFYFNNGNAGVGAVKTAEKSGYIVLEYNNFKYMEETKMKFDITKHAGKCAMHCKTAEEAQEFCDLLHWAGRTWSRGDSYREYTNWKHHKENTAYAFNDGRYCTVDWYIRNGYIILEWADFKGDKPFTKADLKNGDIVLRRNGNVEIYISDFDVFVGTNDINSRGSLNDDLTHMFNNNYDIVVVRRPTEQYDCQFSAFVHDLGKVVYDRKEPEEMTLEQVCRLLGKEIKIVKSKTQ